MSIAEKADRVLAEAKATASTASSWADFSNRLFAQNGGVVAKVFPRMKDRQAFYDTPQYEAVNQLLLDLIKRHGLSEAASKKSGKFVIRLPKTLHAALELEAEQEGVSLNQLALSKLSVPLGAAAGLADTKRE